VTPSADFPVYPTTNGLQTAFGGGPGDVFVAKLFPRNAALQARRPDVMGSGGVSILWPRGLPDFDLQSTDNLQGTNTVWLTVTNPPSVVGDDNALTYSVPIGNQFFRLRRIR